MEREEDDLDAEAEWDADSDWNDDKFWKCATCNGSGTVNELTAPPGFFCVGTEDCPHCDGTGEIG